MQTIFGVESVQSSLTSRGLSSDTVQLERSLPQDSGLSPLKFVIYAAELCELIAWRGIMVHSPVDDTQL